MYFLYVCTLENSLSQCSPAGLKLMIFLLQHPEYLGSQLCPPHTGPYYAFKLVIR